MRRRFYRPVAGEGRGDWRKVKESNPCPGGRHRFRALLRAQHAPPCELVVPARFERATRAFGRRCSCSAELRDNGLAWYAQEESNLQPRSSPELTTGISRPLCQLSYG